MKLRRGPSKSRMTTIFVAILFIDVAMVHSAADENRRWSNQYQQNIQSTYLVNPKNNYPGNTAVSNSPNQFTPSPSSASDGVRLKSPVLKILIAIPIPNVTLSRTLLPLLSDTFYLSLENFEWPLDLF